MSKTKQKEIPPPPETKPDNTEVHWGVRTSSFKKESKAKQSLEESGLLLNSGKSMIIVKQDGRYITFIVDFPGAREANSYFNDLKTRGMCKDCTVSKYKNSEIVK